MVLESELLGRGMWLAPEEVAGWEPVFEALVGQG